MIDFGLEVRGCDLAAVTGAPERAVALERALVRHRVLVFRDQSLSEEQEIAVMASLPHDPHFRPVELTLLGNVDRRGEPLPDTRLPHGAPRQQATPANPHGRPGEYWHCVSAFQPRVERQRPRMPAHPASLRGLQDGAQNAMPQLYSAISAASAVAACGGSATKFVSGTKALQLLTVELRRRAESLAVRNAGGGHAPGQDREGNPAVAELGPRLRHHDDRHGYSHVTNPLARASPHGPSLWVSPNDMERLETIDGGEQLSPEDSHALLQEILAPGTADDVVYEHVWRPGDFVVYDNRSTLHSTVSYDGDRHLHLMGFKGAAGQEGVPLRVGEVVAGEAEIEAFWWSHRPLLVRPPPGLAG